MSAAHDGGRAFPNKSTGYDEGKGMSLRDYFAAKAMQGIVSRDASDDWSGAMISQAAYRQADAMLEARK